MIKKRLAWNLLSTICAQGASSLITFGSIPLFLAFWSKQRYGEWLLVSSVPTYLALAEAGVNTASSNKVSMFVSQGNAREARVSLHTAWGFLLAVSALLLVVSSLGAFLLPWAGILNLSVPDGELRWTIFILSLYTIVTLGGAIFGAVYLSAFKGPRIGFLSSVWRLLEFAATALTVINTTSFIHLALVMLTLRLGVSAMLFWDSRRISPDFRLGLSSFSLAELKSIWRPSLMFMITALGNAIYFQGLTLIVGRQLGPSAVVVFNAVRAMTRAIVQFVSIVKTTIWPEFSYLMGAGDLRRARQLNGLSFEISTVASLVLGGLVYISAPLVLEVWTHGRVPFDNLLTLLLLISAVINGIWFSTSGVLMAVNQHERISLAYVAASALSFGLSIVLAAHWGLVGVALCMVLCEALLLPLCIRDACRVLEQSPLDLLGRAARLSETMNAIGNLIARRHRAA